MVILKAWHTVMTTLGYYLVKSGRQGSPLLWDHRIHTAGIMPSVSYRRDGGHLVGMGVHL